MWARSMFFVLFLLLGVGGGGGRSVEEEYDDKDVQFVPSPPNLLILVVDPINGTTHQLPHPRNSDVVLDRGFGKVHLFCSAYYPIKFIYKGEGFPFLNVDNTRFTEDFYDPTTYAFSALLELEGLKESQTGRYSCQKWDNSSFASYFQLYVPGERIILPPNGTKIYVDAAATNVNIPCAVSDPKVNLTLLKKFDKGQGETDWIKISPSLYTYSPSAGFTLRNAMTALGDLSCSASPTHRVHVTVILNNTAANSREKVREDCCDKEYLRGLGDERTACRAFISSCQTPIYLDEGRSPCGDWKLVEFLKTPVELCKEEIAPSNSSVAVGYFSPESDGGSRLFMYCQADPKEYTQGFKMAVEWGNGSMIFVDEERQMMPAVSEYPSGYEIHAEITDLLNPDSPISPIALHCYIPLKYSFKWIKILKNVPSKDLRQFQVWYSGKREHEEMEATDTRKNISIRGNLPKDNSSLKKVDENVELSHESPGNPNNSSTSSFNLSFPLIMLIILLHFLR